MLTQKQFIKKFRHDVFFALVNLFNTNTKYNGDIALEQYRHFYNQGLLDAKKRSKKRKK